MTGAPKKGKTYPKPSGKREVMTFSLAGTRKTWGEKLASRVTQKPVADLTKEERNQAIHRVIYGLIDALIMADPELAGSLEEDFEAGEIEEFASERALMENLLDQHPELGEWRNIAVRFLGLKGEKPESLAKIGRSYNASREGMRQRWAKIMEVLAQPPISQQPKVSDRELKRYAQRLHAQAEIASHEEQVAEKILYLLDQGHNVGSVLGKLQGQVELDKAADEDTAALEAAIEFIAG